MLALVVQLLCRGGREVEFGWAEIFGGEGVEVGNGNGFGPAFVAFACFGWVPVWERVDGATCDAEPAHGHERCWGLLGACIGLLA